MKLGNNVVTLDEIKPTLVIAHKRITGCIKISSSKKRHAKQAEIKAIIMSKLDMQAQKSLNKESIMLAYASRSAKYREMYGVL